MRMEDHRDTAGAERAAGAGHGVGELGRQLAVDVRPIDSRLLEQRATLEDARDAAAAAWSLPGIGAEIFRTVSVRESAADVGLEVLEELRGAIEEVRHARMLTSSRRAELTRCGLLFA